MLYLAHWYIIKLGFLSFLVTEELLTVNNQLQVSTFRIWSQASIREKLH